MKTTLISVGKRNRSHSWTVWFKNHLRFISVVKIPEVWHEDGATQFFFSQTFMALKSEWSRTDTGWASTKPLTDIHPASLVYRNVISVTRVLNFVIKFKLFTSSNKRKLVITADARPKSPTTMDCSSNGIVGLHPVRSIRERHSAIK
jgi:hypothetical protein